ncbi:MAG: DinB family protein [Promethearchaeota archaeon]
MSAQPPKNLRGGLAIAYEAARDYLRYIITELTPEQAAKEPTPESRTILYYLTHIANSELYWLSASGRKVVVYAKTVPLNIAKDLLEDVRKRILRELKECPEEELVFQPPTQKEKPSLGWVVSHITLHTLYHSGEIIYARYAVGGSDLHSDELEDYWGKMMDSITNLIFSTKQ